MAQGDIDDVTRKLSDVNVTEHITDDQLLRILNELRQNEHRDLLTSLPTKFEVYSQEQKNNLLHRCSREISIHHQLKHRYQTRQVEYPKVILLNKTENLLLHVNQQNPTNPLLTHTTYDKIPVEEQQYYYPHGAAPTPVFITDTPSTYINTPSYSTKHNCFIATHTIPTTSYPQTLTANIPIITTSPEATEQESSEPESPPLNSTIKKKTPKRTRPDFSISSSKTSKESFFGKLKKFAMTSKNSDEDLTDTANTAQVLALEKKNATLMAQIEQMQQAPRQRVPTEREQLQTLEQRIKRITDALEGKLKISDASTLSDTKDDSINITKTLIHSLTRPTNIKAKGERTSDQPSVLKPTTLLATIGPFDPETDKRIDFRKFWDRIIDYLRDYEIYEHEYVHCLLTLMKGTAADIITDINKQYKGDLNKILEALQDIFLPQHTIFDDYDELNKFVRYAGEHIRTTVRRAMILIWKLEHTVSPAAWPDRQYHLIVNIIKQVIDTNTFRHVRAKELECAQTETELSISALTDIIALYEVSHGLTPTNDVPIKYNVNTMQLVDQPNVAATQFQELHNDIQSLMSQVKSLQPGKRPRLEKRDTPMDVPREKAIARRRLAIPHQLPQRSTSQKRSYEESQSSTGTQQNYSQNRESRYSQDRARRYPQSRERSYSAKRYNDYSRNRSLSRGRYGERTRSTTPYRRQVTFDKQYSSNNRYKNNKRYDSRRDYRNNRTEQNTHRNGKYVFNCYTCVFCNTEHKPNYICPSNPKYNPLNSNRRH